MAFLVDLWGLAVLGVIVAVVGGVHSESWNHFSFFFIGVLGDFVFVVTFVGVLQLDSVSHRGVDGGIGLVGVWTLILVLLFWSPWNELFS